MGVNEKMTAVADAIREKTGGTDLLTLDGMAEAIAGIQAGGDILDCTVLSGEITPAEDVSDKYTLVNSSDLPEGVKVYKNALSMFFISAEETGYGENYVAAAISPPRQQAGSQGSLYSQGVVLVDVATVEPHRLAMQGYDWGLFLHCTSEMMLKAGVRYRWIALFPKTA
jgi:hypothetical protein